MKQCSTTDKRTYSSYAAMRQRCLNKNNPNYKYYGGKGITICQRWLDGYQNFLEDMGVRPPNTSIDRIDNDKGYEPDNCWWASPHQQAANTSRKAAVTGVRWDKYMNMWHARMTAKGQEVLSAHYEDVEDAIAARKRAERRFLK